MLLKYSLFPKWHSSSYYSSSTKFCPGGSFQTLQPIQTKLSEGMEGVPKGCTYLSKFSRCPPLKILADVSDLSKPFCDLKEN
jgi:hypothetical protein